MCLKTSVDQHPHFDRAANDLGGKCQLLLGQGIPVTFAPGRAWLATRPKATGSVTAGATIGMAAVACLIAIAASVLTAIRTSGLSPTSSSTSAGKRAKSPSA